MLRLIGETNIDFIGRRRPAFLLSLTIIVLGVASMVLRGGIRMGVDFTGGVQVEVAIESDSTPADIGRVRDAVATAGYDNRNIQQIGGAGGNQFLIHVQADAMQESSNDSTMVGVTTSERIMDSLRSEFASETVVLRDRYAVGPKVGNELRMAALQAIFLAMILIVIYVGWRFEVRYALATLVAVGHDVLVTLSLFSLFNKEMTLSIVAALLTLVGYSVNDTIVIFDRIREELKHKQRRESNENIFNSGINKTLSRTVLTSVTTLFILGALLFYGGAVIHDFAWVLTIGIFVGTYSSIFIAAPLVIVWHKRQALREAKKAA